MFFLISLICKLVKKNIASLVIKHIKCVLQFTTVLCDEVRKNYMDMIMI